MNKTYLLSAIALGAMVITWAPVEARADSLACSQASAKALQQRAAAGKCDPHSGLSPQMKAALAMAGQDKAGGANEEADDMPEQEAATEAGSGDGGDEDDGEEGSAGGTGKGKKLPGDKIVINQPGAEIDINKTPVVKKQPKDGDIIIAEKIEELEFGTPEKHEPAIAEEIEELEFGEPAKKPALAEEVEDLGLAKKEKKEPSLAKKIEDLFFGEPTKDTYTNDHAGKGDKDHASGQGGQGDKGGKESKGPKGGNGFAG
nr:hypothetical protein [uncultured Dongia sp.]